MIDGEKAVITLLVEEDRIELELTHDRSSWSCTPAVLVGAWPAPLHRPEDLGRQTIDDLMVRFAEAHVGY